MSKERKWDKNTCLKRMAPKNGRLSKIFEQKTRRTIQDKDVTDDLLEECYVMIARIVKQHGEEYLPIFERLHTEIEERKSRKKLIELAHNVSENTGISS